MISASSKSLRTLPLAVRGKSSTSSKRSGIFCFAMPDAATCAASAAPTATGLPLLDIEVIWLKPHSPMDDHRNLRAAAVADPAIMDEIIADEERLFDRARMRTYRVEERASVLPQVRG